MGNELKIGDVVKAKIIAVQGYGFHLEYGKNRIIVLVSDIKSQDAKQVLKELAVGDMCEVRIDRTNERTGEYVGAI